METLRGIRIFGYGTIIPMELIPRRITNGQLSLQASRITSGFSTPITTDDYLSFHNQEQQHHQHQQQQLTPQPEQIQGHESNFGVDSPTRIGSSANINSLDKVLSANSADGSVSPPMSGDLFNNSGLFNDKLFEKIVEKAEFGRVVMGVQEI